MTPRKLFPNFAKFSVFGYQKNENVQQFAIASTKRRSCSNGENMQKISKKHLEKKQPLDVFFNFL